MSVLNTIKHFGRVAGIALKAKAPQICFAGGILAGGAAMIFTAKETPKAVKLVKKKTKAIESLNKAVKHPEKYALEDKEGNRETITPAEYKKQKRLHTAETIKGLIKVYGKALAFACLSVALLGAGFKILNGRLTATAGALSSMTAAYNKLSTNVKYKYGEEEFKKLRYTDLKAIDKAETPEEKEKLSDVWRSYKNDKSGVAICWDECNVESNIWDVAPNVRMFYLEQFKNELNKELATKTIINMNRVCDILHCPNLKCKEFDAIKFVHGIDSFDFGENFDKLLDALKHTSPLSPEMRPLIEQCSDGFIFEFVPKATIEDLKKINWRNA